MSWLQALLLGILQGLTEFLPVSSSGHLAILSHFFGLSGEESLTFTVVLHVATVCSTLVVLWKEIVWIFRDLFARQSWRSYNGLNEGTRYAIKLIISMIPVALVGFFFKDKVEEVFGSGLRIVGVMLLVTALLLAFSYYAKPRQRANISGFHAFIIGIGQALAVMPAWASSALITMFFMPKNAALRIIAPKLLALPTLSSTITAAPPALHCSIVSLVTGGIRGAWIMATTP